MKNDKQKAYYEKNKEKITEQRKIYYEKNKEKFKKQRKAYYEKNKEKIKAYQKEKYVKREKKIDIKKTPDYQKNYQKRWRELNKDYWKKYSQKKSYKDYQQKYQREYKSKNYIFDSKLTYELILSKGKGSPTEKLMLYIYKICKGINSKFKYNDSDMRYDILMESYLKVLNSWKTFNEKKYNKSFPFISEIVKRAHAKNFKDLSNNNHYDINDIFLF